MPDEFSPKTPVFAKYLHFIGIFYQIRRFYPPIYSIDARVIINDASVWMIDGRVIANDEAVIANDGHVGMNDASIIAKYAAVSVNDRRVIVAICRVNRNDGSVVVSVISVNSLLTCCDYPLALSRLPENRRVGNEIQYSGINIWHAGRDV